MFDCFLLNVLSGILRNIKLHFKKEVRSRGMRWPRIDSTWQHLSPSGSFEELKEQVRRSYPEINPVLSRLQLFVLVLLA